MQDKSESLKTKSAKHFNTKSGKSYRSEYSAAFSYSDGRSETITGTEIPEQHLRELNIGRGTKKLITMEIRWIGQIFKFII